MNLNLFDSYDGRSQDLHRSLKIAGFKHPTLTIEADGFLPKDVTSIFLSYLVEGEEKLDYRPVFFNEIQVPDFWEIRGTSSSGEVYSNGIKKANIKFAEPKNKRFVKDVEWLDERGQIRFVDHYCQYGWRYSQTTFTKENTRFTTSYYNKNSQEIFVENYLTKNIIVNAKDGKIKIFRNRTDLVTNFLKEKKLEQANLWFNSLSVPLFVSNGLENNGKDYLFWQESFSGEIPGNLSFILNKKEARVEKIIIQNKETYKEINQRVQPELRTKLYSLGTIYPFSESVKTPKNIFILTNSDQIEELNKITTALPDVTFHIAALTEMSSKLHAFESNQVRLYPNIKIDKMKQLLKKCDVYLDINRGAEVLKISRVAFEHSLLLFAFEETLHKNQYIQPENIFKINDVDQMIQKIKRIYNDVGIFRKELNNQKINANAAKVEDYQTIL